MTSKGNNSSKNTRRKNVIRFGLVLLIAGAAGAVAAAGLHLHINGADKPAPGAENTAQRQHGSTTDGQESNITDSIAPADTERAQQEDGCERSRRVEELYSMLHPPDSRREALQSIQEGRERIKALHSAADGSRRSADEMMDDKPR